MASLTSSASQPGATVSVPLREPRPPRGLCGCALEWLGRQAGNPPIQGGAVPVRLEQSGEYLQIPEDLAAVSRADRLAAEPVGPAIRPGRHDTDRLVRRYRWRGRLLGPVLVIGGRAVAHLAPPRDVPTESDALPEEYRWYPADGLQIGPIHHITSTAGHHAQPAGGAAALACGGKLGVQFRPNSPSTPYSAHYYRDPRTGVRVRGGRDQGRVDVATGAPVLVDPGSTLCGCRTAYSPLRGPSCRRYSRSPARPCAASPRTPGAGSPLMPSIPGTRRSWR